MITLLLVRHATTYGNEAGCYIGYSESEISPKGYKELEQLKTRLAKWPIDSIYMSPSKRVIETVLAVTNLSVKRTEVEALKEINFGCFEGKDFNWVKKHQSVEIERMLKEGSAYVYPKGESLVMAHKRIASWLSDFFKVHQEGTFLIAAHGGTIRSILSELLVKDASLHWQFKIEPASLSVVTIEQGFPVITTLNERGDICIIP